MMTGLVSACLVALVAIAASIIVLSMTTDKENRPRIVVSGASDVVLLQDGREAGGTTIRFPLVSFGLPVHDTDATAYNLTRIALEVGCRGFVVDTVHQKAFAQAIVASGVPRQTLFITGAVPSLNEDDDDDECSEKILTQMTAFHHPEDEFNDACEWKCACRKNLAAFAAGDVHTLDQILLDVPPGWSCDWIRGQWRALEELVLETHQVRTLAVSNFFSQQLDCLLHDNQQLKVKPIVNQLPFSVTYHRDEVIQENMERELLVQAWAPLGGSAHKFNATVRAACTGIGKHYGSKSFAQVALRWIVQKGAAFTTRSTDRQHFAENLNIFDFELLPKDMAFLDSLAASACVIN